MDLNLVLKDVTSLAREVGSVQLEKLSTNISYKAKSTDIDMVTEVDILSEKIIINRLKENYPTHSILSEESGLSVNDDNYTWVIDPLDGTTNYLHGFPIFSVSIALMHKGETVLGVVYIPKLDEMFTAVKNEGAYMNGKKIEVGNRDNLRSSIFSTGFPYDKTTSEDNNLNIFNSIIKEIQGIRRTGSAAFDLCNAASGRIDGYWELKLSKWDIAAGELIVREAGGKIITSRLKKSETELGYNIIAGNSSIVDILYQRINEIEEYFKQK